MQVAGMPCGYCGEKIVTAEEGTWCADCGTRYHRECLNKLNQFCQTCGRRYGEPESHFVYAKSCPECHRPTNGRAEWCTQCRAPTVWHTKEEFESFKADYVRGHRHYLYAGIGLIALGILVLAWAVLELVGASPIGFHLSPHFGVAAMVAGSWFVWHYSETRRFE